MSEKNNINNIFGDLKDSLEEKTKLSEKEFLFANLMYKTDFVSEEIEDFLEWEPNNKQMERIRERVSDWRSPDEYNDILFF